MLEALTGSGLAAAAGLNAYIPLVAVGLLSRYTDWITLPPDWQWLENNWVLAILGVLLVVEVAADKVPVVDHINDMIGTVVRPAAGGLAFGATTDAATISVPNPSDGETTWGPLLAGAAIALVVHTIKATVRPVANVTTAGTAAPVVSTGEDLASVAMSLVAIVLPILVLVLFVAFLAVAWWLWRRRSRLRERRRGRQREDTQHVS